MSSLEDKIFNIAETGLESRSSSVQKVRDAIESGARTRREIADRTGLGYGYVTQAIREYGMDVEREPSPNQKLNKQLVDGLIKIGLGCTTIAREVGVSNARIGIYRERWYHGEWRKKREEYKNALNLKRENEEEKRRLIGEIEFSVLKNSLGNEGYSDWVIQKTFEHRQKHPSTRAFPYDKLAKFFSVYEEAKKKGEKASLYALGERAEMHFVTVGHVLKEGGLNTLVNPMKKKREILTPEQEDAIARAIGLRMPVSDLSYFIGAPNWIIQDRFNMMNRQDRIKSHIICMGRFSCDTLSYAKASDIYLGQDIGMSREEIERELGLKREIVDYALRNENIFRISGEIIDALKTIWPEREIKKPYKDW